MTDWNDSKAADDLRKAMRTAIPVEDSDHVSARRERLVGIIEQEIAHVPLRGVAAERRSRLLRFGMAAAALCVFGLSGAVLVEGWTPNERSSVAGPATSPTPVAPAADSGAELSLRSSVGSEENTNLRVGSTIRLRKSETATLRLPGPTRMDLSEEGRLKLMMAESHEQTVLLAAGRLAVEVQEGQAKMRHVQVRTPHAEVHVTGTRFIVDVATSADGTPETTAVAVQKGEVLVRFEGGSIKLRPGDSWTSQVVGAFSVSQEPGDPTTDPNLPGTSSPTTKKATLRSGSSSKRVGAPVRSKPTSPADESSTLALQNSLLEHAVWLEQQGRHQQADAVLTRLLRSYPDSPLRSTVQAERRRLRARVPTKTQ